jgi:hypothetical protein
MSEDAMRMRAQVIDEASGPLKSIADRMKEIRVAPGMRQAREEMEKLQSQFRSVTTLAANVTGSIAAVGLSSITAAASFGAFVAAMKNSADTANGLRVLAQDTGMAVNALHRLEAIGKRFEIPTDAIDASVKNISGKLPDLKRGIGELYGILNEKDPAFAAQLRADAQRGDTGAAFGHSLGFLQKFKDEQERRRWSAEIFGDPNLSRMFPGGSRDEFDKAAKEAEAAGTISKELLEASESYKKAIINLGDAFDRLKNEVAPGPIRAMTAVFEALQKIASDTRNELELLAAAWERIRKATGLSPPDRASVARDIEFNQRQLRSVDQLIANKENRGEDARDSKAHRDRIIDELRQLNEKLQNLPDAMVQKQAFYGNEGGFGGLLQRASLTVGGGPGGGIWSGRSGGGRFNGLGLSAGDRAGGGARSAIPGSAGDGGGNPMGPVEGRPENPMHSRAAGGGVGPSGSAHAATRAAMMGFAMDQLRSEGVPEASLRAAAAHLVGQADMESGLRPWLSHDGGTGYGIYGARLGRRSAMLAWLSKNGYARDSAEGQQRYMAHDAMSGRYRRTRDILMNASPEMLARDSWAVTREFESPAVTNNRSGAVLQAYRAAVAAARNRLTDAVQSGRGWPDQWMDMSRFKGRLDGGDPSVGRFRGDLLGDAERAGFLGAGKVTIDGGASIDLNIKTPRGMQVDSRASLQGGYLKGVKVRRGVTMPDAAEEVG